MNERPRPPLPVATIMDVARDAGVSVRTVSRVLNNSPKVGAETRQAIEDVIVRLGFTPSIRARGLAARRSFLLGLVQGDQNAHVIGAIQRGVVEICSEAGYELLVHPVVIQDPKLTDKLRDFVRRTHVDALVMLPPVSELEDVAGLLAHLAVPAVGIAAVPVAGYPAMLVSDERNAASAVADHFVALGHRRIAMITGPLNLRSATEREQGFRIALARAGITLPAFHVRAGDYSFASGVTAATNLLTLPERPTAIFASNDIMAAATLKVARTLGIDVPLDLSIAGFDDSDIASMVSPTLTTVRRPLLTIAREATRRAIAMAEGNTGTLPDYQVELDLILRESTMAMDRQRGGQDVDD